MLGGVSVGLVPFEGGRHEDVVLGGERAHDLEAVGVVGDELGHEQILVGLALLRFLAEEVLEAALELLLVAAPELDLRLGRGYFRGIWAETLQIGSSSVFDFRLNVFDHGWNVK